MSKIAEKYGERILETPDNKISIAMSLNNICKDAKDKQDITKFGSLFFSRQISGIKVLAPSGTIEFNNFKFNNYGTHCENYHSLPYCAFAAAIGITDYEVDKVNID